MVIVRDLISLILIWGILFDIISTRCYISNISTGYYINGNINMGDPIRYY